MNSLFKLTLVSIAVLQSGLSGISTVRADEVTFLEVTSARDSGEPMSNRVHSELSFTETIVNDGGGGEQSSWTVLSVESDSIESPSGTSNPTVLSKTTIDKELNSIPATEIKPPMAAKDDVVPVVTTTEVVFREESPALAAARPVQRQGSAEFQALEEQIKNKLGKRNDLAILRQAQANAADLEKQQGRLILLTNVAVEGNTVLDEMALDTASAPFVGRRIKLSDLEELRVQLSRLYVEKGYINSGVVLPDQKVENGNIVYTVVEGSLAEVNIEGEGSLREKYITDRIALDVDKPFNTIALQEKFQLLLDDPLIERLDGKLRTLPGRGSSALDLKVTRARPYDFSIVTSNHGTPSLGAGQVFATGVMRNISGFGDTLGITIGGNGNKFNFTTEYEVPIRSDDTRVQVRLTATDSTVAEEPLDTIDIESSSLGADLSITRPLKRTIKESMVAGTGISIRSSSNSLQGIPFSFSAGEEDGSSKVSVARVWQEYVRRGDSDVLAARAGLNLGLDMFGSTVHDDDRPDSEFLTAQAQLQYVRNTFEERAQMILRLEGQIASRKLLPLERFSLGGAGTVRGYRENELVRDQAVFASAELRYPFYRSADFGTFQLAPFVDIGYARNKTFFIADEFLASVGLGLLWDLGTHLSGELYLGAGLNDGERAEQEDLQDHGVHLKIVAKY